MKHYKIRQTAIDRNVSSVAIYLKSIKNLPILTTSQEQEILYKIKKGDENARKYLIQSCLRFVVTIAKQYQNQGVELSDLIEAGNEGLMRAVDSFKNEKGVKFITYAVWWIRKMIIKELNLHNHSISIPEVNLTALNKIKEAANKFELENERPPTNEELAQILDMDLEVLETICDGVFTKIDPNIEDTNILENIAETPNSQTCTEVSEKIDELSKTLLTPVEYEIISKNFGYTGIEYSIEDIAKSLNISKDRTRQIRNRALNKLKSNKAFINWLREQV